MKPQQESEEWEELKNYPDYEIRKTGQPVIRNKATHELVNEYVNSSGYIHVRVKGSKYPLPLHDLVINQWKPKPENTNSIFYIDHINHDRQDNRKENLRWITASQNTLNKNSSRGINYEFIEYEDAPEDIEELKQYKESEFNNLFYSKSTGKFYLDVIDRLRILHVGNRGYVQVQDKKGNRRSLKIDWFMN